MEVVQFCNKGQYFPARIGSDSFDSKRRNVRQPPGQLFSKIGSAAKSQYNVGSMFINMMIRTCVQFWILNGR